MSASAKLLLQREYASLKSSPISTDYVVLDLVHDRITEGTCFQGGSFLALVRFPQDYPNSPPSVQFQSHIFHPNIYRDGKVCISTLQLPPADASAEDSNLCWSCVLGAHGALESVVSLIGDPNPDDPANSEAAGMFLSDFDHFAELARQASEDSKHDLPAAPQQQQQHMSSNPANTVALGKPNARIFGRIMGGAEGRRRYPRFGTGFRLAGVLGVFMAGRVGYKIYKDIVWYG
ncbi:hypothetical protein BASA81_004422 [Batrachochytrium salamandrivorans]|nr:hypothetical protein BASA81_004422 [Batrachochytrium salamandrivorans]